MPNKIVKIYPSISDANSQSLFVGEVFLKNGDPVVKDQLVATYESSKKSYELISETSGFIYLNCKVGDVVSLESLLAIVSSSRLTNDEVLTHFDSSQVNSKKLKITSKAMKLIKDFSINLNEFNSESELSFDVVNNYLLKTKKIKLIDIDRESKALCENIEPNTYSSFLSININEDKLQKNIKKISNDSVGIVSLDAYIAYKVHSVLMKYQKLSSYFNDRNIVRVESCPVGIYLNDEVRGVPVVVEANSLNKIDDTVKRIFELQKEFVSNSFTGEELCCFYISNLSEKNIVNFVPLLKKKTAATLAVCCSVNRLRCIGITFDHRLMEGGYVANFLNDFKFEIEKE